MDKKNLPIEILIPSGAALLSSFLPWASFSLGGLGGGFGFSASANAWNSNVFGIPNLLPVLGLVAIGVFVFLKANDVWTAPKELNLGLAIYGVAQPALFIVVLFGRSQMSASIGAYVAAAAGGYLTYFFLTKGPEPETEKASSEPPPEKPAEERDEEKTEGE